MQAAVFEVALGMILKQCFFNHLRLIFVPSEPEEDPAREPEYVKPKLLPVPGDPGPGPSSASDTSTAIRTVSTFLTCQNKWHMKHALNLHYC